MMPSILEMIDKGKELLAFLSEKREHRRQMAELSVLYGTEMADILGSLHDTYPILTREGHRWPIAVWNNVGDERDDVDTILGSLNEEFSGDISLANYRYLNRLRKGGKRELFNGGTFVMENVIVSDRGLKVNCGLGEYFDAIATCDSLDAELVHAFAVNKPSTVDELLDACPGRRRFCEHCHDPAFSGSGRSAAIGISALIAYRHNNRYLALLRARSSRVAAHPNRHHVIPSGMFTAETENCQDEFSVRHSFYREYQEELFEDRDLGHPSGQLTHDWFYSRQQLRYLMELLADKRAALYLSGYSIDLTNYRPEILLLLIINEPEWTHQRLSPNYEYADLQQLRDNHNDVLLPIDLGAHDSEVASLIDSVGAGIIPPGVAAFWSGKDLLARITS